MKYHGLYDQEIKKILSVSKKQYLEKEVESMTYQYIKVKDSNNFGYENLNVDGGTARIATKKRALLDIIEYRRSISNIRLVKEKLINYADEFNYKDFSNYAVKYSQTAIKTLGLVLDFVEQDTKKLQKLITRNSNSRMTEDSDEFSNKWRLYYNSVLAE